MNPGIFLGMLVFFPFAGALLCFVAGRKNALYRDYLSDILVVFEFLTALLLFVFLAKKAAAGESAASFAVPQLCGMGLSFEADGFRLIYALVTSFMWMMTTILSSEYSRGHSNKNRYYLFLLLTLGATMGVFLSADLFTTFVFFEIMSFTSYVWVAQEETEQALRAAQTYLAVAVTGGMVLLMGVFLTYHVLGTGKISELAAAAAACKEKTVLYAAGGCMLFGFGAKAGAFPLHIWLPKAHPVAPAPASALLSGVLTKTGVYGIIILSANLFFGDGKWGMLILLLGVLTMFGGALLAVFSIDLKRTLACSSMSQIGFILVGIGMMGLLGEESALAVHGTMLHMVNHSMIKLVLFMAAGVIFMNTHALDLNEIRGYGRKKPLLAGIFAVGALAIGGIPFFGGYISKTLLHESIVEYAGGIGFTVIEWIFLISGGMTVAYMTKLFLAIFVEQNEDREKQKKFDAQKHYMNAESTFALGGSALVLLLWGLFLHQIMDRAAALGQSFFRLEEAGERVSYFSLKNLSGGGISILIGAAVYILLIRGFLMREESAAEKANYSAKTAKRGKAQKKSASMQSAGTKRYVNLWPSWLDLEELIYRPLIRLLSLCFGVLCRILDSAVDLTVVALRKTVYRDSPLPHERPEGNILTEVIGTIGNFFRNLLNHTVHRKQPVQRDYVHYFAVKREELKENNVVIGRSLSFALLLLCIGFMLTLYYLIWW